MNDYLAEQTDCPSSHHRSTLPSFNLSFNFIPPSSIARADWLSCTDMHNSGCYLLPALLHNSENSLQSVKPAFMRFPFRFAMENQNSLIGSEHSQGCLAETGSAGDFMQDSCCMTDRCHDRPYSFSHGETGTVMND